MAVFFPLWSLNYSQNALSFLKFARMIVLMEFLPTHLVIDPIMDLFGLEKSCTEDDLDCQEDDENSNDLQLDLGPVN